MIGSLLVLAVSCIAVLHGQQICTRPTSKPNISPTDMPATVYITFTAEVEIFESESKQVKAMTLRYDQVTNKIRLTYLSDGNKVDVFYLFDDNEILTFNFTDLAMGVCTTTTNLANSPLTFIVGGAVKNETGANYFVPPVLQLFHISGNDAAGQEIWPQPPTKGKVRDKDVSQFISCQQWKLETGEMFTAKVTHSFSTQEWTFPKKMPILLEMRVQGKLSNGKAIDHTYSYFDVDPEVGMFSLETPPGIPCDGRKIDKPFPILPKFVQLSKETIDYTKNIHYFADEIYDSDNRFMVMRIQKTYSSFIDAERNLLVFDYNSGLTYHIDRLTKACKTSNITDDNKSQMEFGTSFNGTGFQFDNKAFFWVENSNISYLGKRLVRGMLADTWVAEGHHESLGLVAVEWYFADKTVHTWNDNLKGVHPIPVKRRIWNRVVDERFKKFAQPTIDTNIFHVDYTRILFNSFSIRTCSSDSAANHFQVMFKGATTVLKMVNIQYFKWKAVKTIATFATIAWLRVTDFKLFYAQDDAIIEFEIMDQPPYASDSSPKHKNNLYQASQQIKNLVEGGKFWLPYTLEGKTTEQKLYAYPTYKFHVSTPGEMNAPAPAPPVVMDIDVEEENEADHGLALSVDDSSASGDKDISGYSTGALAGLGIVMLIIGTSSGGGLSYYLIFKRGTVA